MRTHHLIHTLAFLLLAQPIAAQQLTDSDGAIVSLTDELRRPGGQVQADTTKVRRIQEQQLTGPFKVTFTSLYAATFAIQAFDVDSTIKAITRGGIERNPIMAPLSKNPLAFLAIKTGGTAAVLYATHRAARQHKLAAVAARVALNTSYFFIVRNNYAIARRESPRTR